MRKLTHHWRRHGALVAVAFGFVLFVAPAQGDNPPPILASADWLTTVNYYRAMAVLGTVSENTTWSDGDQKHAIYMAENREFDHDETFGNTWYTPEGNAAAATSNVAGFWVSPGPINCPDRTMIEFWIAGPFHLTGIIDPKLQTTGWGKYISQVNFPNQTCAAALDVINGRTGAAAGPIKFPGPGMTTPVLTYKGAEFPDPLLSCGFGATFQNPSGPAIVLMFTAAPPTTATGTLTDNGTPVNGCVRDEFSRSELSFRHVVYLMPQFPLVSSHAYAVDIAIGGTHYTWTFFACEAGLTGGSCNVPTAVVVRTATALRTRAGVFVRWRSASEGQTLGFNVYRSRNGKLVRLNRSLIPSVFGGTSTGQAYSWLDRRAPRASSGMQYRIESVGFDGTRTWVADTSVLH
jgi:hypothetical protein